MIDLEKLKAWKFDLEQSRTLDDVDYPVCDRDKVEAVISDIETAIADAYRAEARRA